MAYFSSLNNQGFETLNNVLPALSSLLWQLPDEVRALQRIPILRVARALGLRPCHSEKHTFEIQLHFWGEYFGAFLRTQSNDWIVDPDATPLSTILCTSIFSTIELASFGLHHDLSHLPEAVAFLREKFPTYLR